MRALLNTWIAGVPALLRSLGPYAAIELLLPGGSVIALLIWLYRHRANVGERGDESARASACAAAAISESIGIPSHLSLPPCRYPTLSLSRDHRAPSLIENGRNDHGIARADLYRQMDAQDLVFAQREASSTRGVTPPPRKRLPANAHQNSAQSRIDWVNQQARDEIEDHCCRVFLDRTWKDNHRTAQRYVPLGHTLPQGCEC